MTQYLNEDGTPRPGKSCSAPWGETVQDGQSVVAYKDAEIPWDGQPVSETRTCNDGNLTGSFDNKTYTSKPKPFEAPPVNTTSGGV